MNKNIIIIIVVLVVLVGLAFVVSNRSSVSPTDQAVTQEEEQNQNLDDLDENDVQRDDQAESQEDANTAEGGTYEDYDEAKLAKAETGDVVIFFHADWCPTCRALESEIKSNMSEVPSDLTILKADYDSQTKLRQKYGVTFQHTLVQVDAQGNQIAKWVGSPTLSELVRNIK